MTARDTLPADWEQRFDALARRWGLRTYAYRRHRREVQRRLHRAADPRKRRWRVEQWCPITQEDVQP
jgi:hypothetical protein